METEKPIKTKLVSCEDLFKVEVFLRKPAEHWRSEDYVAVIKYYNDEVKLNGQHLTEVVRRIGHVLLALTERAISQQNIEG